MKKKAFYIFLSVPVVLLSFYFTFSDLKKPSKELELSMMSPFSNIKSKVIAASCAYGIHGSSDEYTTCTRTHNCCYGPSVTVTDATSQCGGACTGGTAACTPHPTTGQPCVSEPNACGQTTTGTYDSCGICTATAPTVPSCTLTNVCGQTFAGGLCPVAGSVPPRTTCNANNGTDNINNSCIATFEVNSSNVNPNGAVDFSWSIVEKAGVKPICGFVDLTTPTPRLIPGLQNLDTSVDRTRISNIQTTTRFCLVCKFYSVLAGGGTGELLGEGIAHQWIRVIRIGEN